MKEISNYHLNQKGQEKRRQYLRRNRTYPILNKITILRIVAGLLIAFSIFRWMVYYASTVSLYSYYGWKCFLYAWPDALIAFIITLIGVIIWEKTKRKEVKNESL